MGIVALHDDVLGRESVNALDGPCPPELRERAGLALELGAQRIDVVAVYVGVPELDDELVRIGVGNMGDHVREEGVGGDVEGDAEAEVGRTLVHEAGELGFGGGAVGGGEMDVELAHHVAGREGHVGYI
ncbi:hypothetical protein GSI_11059 [Ganoderma sinense ZZ0214-1]|uniref:Uncharacterized protein n=1 Tax=Ganoderma sinense ZZ0214-1 TaxID=1077348 RepID=A0A2G8RZD0_9APHY|nr:hypothetical protein GSI_11059 [Ganoderma sinense ZZ0214-1]